MKIVYNACHGGFGLSDAAVRRYAELLGLKLYPEVGQYGLTTYWVAPPEQRSGIIAETEWFAATDEQKAASNRLYDDLVLSPRDIDRADVHLVRVIEEMGEAANGRHAELSIADVPAGQRYRIDEYDGAESVMTIDDYEWKIAV